MEILCEIKDIITLGISLIFYRLNNSFIININFHPNK